MIQTLYNKLKQLKPELIDIRRNLHMYPELSNHEEKTPKMIADFLENVGIDVKRNVGGNGVVGYLRGDKEGKTIALRADFDALPIQDEKDVPYKSRIDGVSHACGHDVHTAALLGVAQVLSEHVSDLHGTVVFIHQFAEEVAPGGATRMIEAGCLEGVEAIYGSHVWSENDVGEILFIEGPAMAASDTFKIKVRGKGGHGALPHEAIDPIVSICQLVINMQQIISRKVDPIESAVLSVGSIHSGKAQNVIPNFATITGTIRTFNDDIRKNIKKELEQMCSALDLQNDVNTTLDYMYGHTSLYNNADKTRELKKTTLELLSNHDVKDRPPLMVAEDFSFYLKKVPGTFFFVGGKNPSLQAVYPHHHSKFNVDEEAITTIGKVFFNALLNEKVINR